MSTEQNHPSMEGTAVEGKTIRLDHIAWDFINGIDQVRNGEKQSAVLFEGDYDLTNKEAHGNQIDIGEGHTIDAGSLSARFIREIARRGSIASIKDEKTKEIIRGFTNAAKYHRRVLPNTRFPLLKTEIKLDTKEGEDLTIYRERFFQREDDKIPVVERWVASRSREKDLSTKPSFGQTKDLVLV